MIIKMKMKKEKIKKEEPPKVLVQIPSVYWVQVDPKTAQVKGFLVKIMEKLVPYFPLRKNQSLTLEFELKDFESGIVKLLMYQKNTNTMGFMNICISLVLLKK